MLYLARVLHLPDGECRYNVVVETEAGVVVGTEQFSSEKHSMMLVDEVFLTVRFNEERKSPPHCNVVGDVPLYACSVERDGVLKQLE